MKICVCSKERRITYFRGYADQSDIAALASFAKFHHSSNLKEGKQRRAIQTWTEFTDRLE